MRQAEREIKNMVEIGDILQKCDTCRLALSDDGQPYVVPLNFGYQLTDGQLTLYFHCALQAESSRSSAATAVLVLKWTARTNC